MKKNRARKRPRPLTFEQLETKATPAALLIGLAPLDESFHRELEAARAELPPQAPTSAISAPALDSAGNWQFSHSVVNLLRFVEDNTLNSSKEPTVCSAPTWDQCQIADEMMTLRDSELRTLVIATQLPGTERAESVFRSDSYAKGF